MDDIVRAALAKWPNVPHCYGWLGLDARGNWYMRDDRTQANGDFGSGRPGSKGSLLRHDKLIDFIHRNYLGDAAGQWFFQNGPQRVYVELEATPLVMRVSDQGLVQAHTGADCRVKRCLVDEAGRVYLETDLGVGLVHTQDMLAASDMIDQGRWRVDEIAAPQLQRQFGFVASPATARAGALTR